MARTSGKNLLQSRLDQLLDSRAFPKTICPSEAPRSLSAAELQELGAREWRDLMDDARTIVWRMRDLGQVEILQRGQTLDENIQIDEVKGPIRVRRKAVETPSQDNNVVEI